MLLRLLASARCCPRSDAHRPPPARTRVLLATDAGPWRYTNTRSTVGLWDSRGGRGGERSTFDARDATGRHAAYVTNISGPWTIYLTPWASGREGGLTIGPFEDATAAMAEADRIAGRSGGVARGSGTSQCESTGTNGNEHER